MLLKRVRNTEMKVTSLLNKEEVMFHRIIEREDVFYRDEQQGSRDLSTDEKKRILMDLFDANPVLFMGRYYHYLSTDDCQCFDMENPEILLYCNIIKNKVNEKKGITIRNRRYAELLRLKYQTNYFSNEKMREREPKIFDEMVGQYLSDEEKTQLRPVVTDVKLSTTLLKAFDENGKYHHSESKCFENFPDSEHFGNLTKHAMCRAYEENSYGGEVVNESSSPPNTDIFIPLSDYEDFTTSVEQKVAQLRDDFVDYMEQRFLKGEDDRFVDYASIDDQSFSREYEKLREQNLEDAYFADD